MIIRGKAQPSASPFLVPGAILSALGHLAVAYSGISQEDRFSLLAGSRRTGQLSLQKEPAKSESCTAGGPTSMVTRSVQAHFRLGEATIPPPDYIIKIAGRRHKIYLCSIVLPGSYGGWRPWLALGLRFSRAILICQGAYMQLVCVYFTQTWLCGVLLTNHGLLACTSVLD